VTVSQAPLSILSPSGAAAPGADPGWSEDRVLNIHRAMVRSRVLDEHVARLQRRGLVGLWAPAHGYEAHIYGALTAMKDEDWLFADARMTGAALYRGLDVRSWLAMLLGSGGSGHNGHAMSSEMTASAHNFVTISSPLGTQIIQASGTAHAMKLRKQSTACLTWFGPAAAASGDFHVGLNFAGLYKVPAVFYLCTSGDEAADRERFAGEAFVDKADGYGIEGVRVDGSDVFAVYAAVAAAAKRARKGLGPTLIEGLTGGINGDADPVERLEVYMADRGIDVEEAQATAGRKLRPLLKTWTTELLGEGSPELRSLFDHVYDAPTPQLLEQREGLEAHRRRFQGGGLA
jgi:pyruvate dehydrogenase E1 component alpha subunit